MKQHAAMSLFVKHVADKQHFSFFFSDATVDIAMPSHCTASSHAAFRSRTRSDHVTRNALAARNNLNEAYSPSLSLEILVVGVLLLAVFILELEMDYPCETSLCTVAPFPTDSPFSDFF